MNLGFRTLIATALIGCLPSCSNSVPSARSNRVGINTSNVINSGGSPGSKSSDGPGSDGATPTPTPSATLAPSSSPPPAGRYSPSSNGFVIGYNQAWFHNLFNSSLSPDRALGITKSDFDLDYLKSMFSGIKAAGGSVVRFWLVMDQEGLILGTTSPQTQDIEPEMLTNIENLLKVARDNDIQIYFTILEMCDQKDTVPQQEQTYYYNLFNNKNGEADRFNKVALLPILQKLNAYRPQVYAIDLYNEIMFAVQNGFFDNGWQGAQNWIRNTAKFIHDNSSWVSVTTTIDPDNLNQLSGLGLDFYDIHIYTDRLKPADINPSVQKAKADGKPIILGEYGQGSSDLNDTLQLNTTASFLNVAQAAGFTAALAWRYDSSADDQWTFFEKDGSLRPAVNVIKGYAKGIYKEATVTTFVASGKVGLTRCGNTWSTPSSYTKSSGSDCYQTVLGDASSYPKCNAGVFGWSDGNIYETRCGCGSPKSDEQGSWETYNQAGLTCFKKVIGPVLRPLTP